MTPGSRAVRFRQEIHCCIPRIDHSASFERSAQIGPQQQFDYLVTTAKGAWLESGVPTSAYGLIDAGAALSSCTAATLAVTPASPQVAGTTVNWTASATGCSAPQVQWWVYNNNTATWQFLRDWSTAATYSWSTTGLAAGWYEFFIYARADSFSGAQASTYQWYLMQ